MSLAKSLKESMSFAFEKNRLASFKSWIFTNKHACSAEKMAEAGFIFIGSSKEPDLVRCFFCNKQLEGWEKDDNPWEEHLSHSSLCKFAITKTPEEMMTINQFLDLTDALIEKNIEDYFDSKVADLDQLCELVDRNFLKNHACSEFNHKA